MRNNRVGQTEIFRAAAVPPHRRKLISAICDDISLNALPLRVYELWLMKYLHAFATEGTRIPTMRCFCLYSITPSLFTDSLPNLFVLSFAFPPRILPYYLPQLFPFQILPTRDLKEEPFKVVAFEPSITRQPASLPSKISYSIYYQLLRNSVEIEFTSIE